MVTTPMTTMNGNGKQVTTKVVVAFVGAAGIDPVDVLH
jgi:hypothetical protein